MKIFKTLNFPLTPPKNWCIFPTFFLCCTNGLEKYKERIWLLKLKQQSLYPLYPGREGILKHMRTSFTAFTFSTYCLPTVYRILSYVSLWNTTTFGWKTSSRNGFCSKTSCDFLQWGFQMYKRLKQSSRQCFGVIWDLAPHLESWSPMSTWRGALPPPPPGWPASEVVPPGSFLMIQ